MWAIWVKKLLPTALNGCPKCKKSPNLVSLYVGQALGVYGQLIEI